MNTPTIDDRLQAIETDEARDAAPEEETARLTALGKVSDTQGGLGGNKYDSGYGWQFW